jgi:hypothetical protein
MFVPALKMPVARARSLFREPFRDRLHAGRKTSAFAQCHGRSRDAESGDGTREGVGHFGQTPEHDREREAAIGAGVIHQSSHQQIAEGIGKLKCGDNVAVIDFAPVELELQGGL